MSTPHTPDAPQQLSSSPSAVPNFTDTSSEALKPIFSSVVEIKSIRESSAKDKTKEKDASSPSASGLGIRQSIKQQVSKGVSKGIHLSTGVLRKRPVQYNVDKPCIMLLTVGSLEFFTTTDAVEGVVDDTMQQQIHSKLVNLHAKEDKALRSTDDDAASEDKTLFTFGVALSQVRSRQQHLRATEVILASIQIWP